MANHQETPPFPTSYDDYEHEDASGCGCFRRFCFGRDGEYLLRDKEGGAWPLAAEVKKLREFSEVVAGPKWKNTIRKIGRVCNPRKRDKAAVEFQYSPESYALNFAGDEDGELLHSFSTKFAPGFFTNDQQGRPAI